jgi:tetratricopeptide (TPR) repeat protein
MSRLRIILIVVVSYVAGAVTTWGFIEWRSAGSHAPIRELLDAGSYEQAAILARRRLAEANRDGSFDSEAALLLARALAKQGKWADAESYFVQVNVTEKDDLHLRADGFVRRQLFDQAAPIYEKILEHWPTDGPALRNLATIRSQQGLDEEAIVLARRLVEVPSFEVIGHTLCGMLEFHVHHYDQAIACLQEALRLSPDLEGVPVQRHLVFLWLAESLVKTGNGPEAERIARLAEKISPTAESSYIMGLARALQADDKGTLQYLHQSVQREPKYVNALRELGRIYLAQGQPQEAVEWLKRAHAIDAEDPAIRYGLYRAYVQLGRPKDAEPFKSASPPPEGKESGPRRRSGGSDPTASAGKPAP